MKLRIAQLLVLGLLVLFWYVMTKPGLVPPFYFDKANRAAFFFMDYPGRTRLKLLGRVRTEDLKTNPDLAAALVDPTYKAAPERAFLIDVEAFDWNCPQHITPRYTLEEIAPSVEALKARIAELEQLVGRQALELEILKKAARLLTGRTPSGGRSS